MFPANRPAAAAMFAGIAAFAALVLAMLRAEPALAGPALAVVLPMALSAVLIWRMATGHSTR